MQHKAIPRKSRHGKAKQSNVVKRQNAKPGRTTQTQNYAWQRKAMQGQVFKTARRRKAEHGNARPGEAARGKARQGNEQRSTGQNSAKQRNAHNAKQK